MSDASDEELDSTNNSSNTPSSPALSVSSTSSSSSPATPPNGKQKKKKKDILFRAKKNIGEKFGSSSMGREMLKKTLADEPRELLECVKRIIAVALGTKTANKVEHNIFKLIIKTKFLFDLMVEDEIQNNHGANHNHNTDSHQTTGESSGAMGKKKAITEEQLHAVDKVIRKAFDVLVELFDYYGPEATQSIEAPLVHRKFLELERLFSQIREQLITMLAPHVTEKSQNRVRYIFDTIGTVTFLKQVWQNPSIENELSELVSACSTYTQFEW